MEDSTEFWKKYHKEDGKNKNLLNRKNIIGALAVLVALAFVSRSCGNDEQTPVTTTTSTTLEATTTTSTTTTTTTTTLLPTTVPETTIPIEIFGFEVDGNQIDCEVQLEPYVVQRDDSIFKIVRLQNGGEEVPEQIAGTIAYNQAKGLLDNPNLIYEGMQLYLLNNCTSLHMPDTL